MHGRWRQSIRWRLVFGSVLLALLTTTLLALTAISVITYYYGADQQNHLSTFANDKAQNIGTIIQSKPNLLANAAKQAINNPNNTYHQVRQPTTIILSHDSLIPVYPNLSNLLVGKSQQTQKGRCRPGTIYSSNHLSVSTKRRLHTI